MIPKSLIIKVEVKEIMKQTSYSIKFDYVEQVLLNLGRDRRKAESDFDSRTHTTLLIVNRVRFLNHAKSCLSEIYNDVNDQTKEMIKLLYIKNNGFEETAKKMGIRESRLAFRHNLIVDEMMVLLGEILESDSRKRVIRRRNIPKKIKEKVFERDEGKCVECSADNNLHYHHIKRYASGGKDTVENLMLLCARCHAEEHKGERSYHLLTAMAEG